MNKLFEFSHLSFDLWLTLIKSNPSYKMKRAQLVKSHFGINDTDENFLKVVKYYDDTCNSINEATGRNLDALEMYSLIAMRYGAEVTHDSLVELYAKSEELFLTYKPVFLDHFNEDFFKQVKASGITTNILSNTGFIKGETLSKFIDDSWLGKYMDNLYFSDEYDLSKPNPEFFRVITDDYPQYKLNEILHIGDNKRADYNGALAFGFDAYLVEN